MKTNFTKKRVYVLMNEDKTPTAVIQCEAGTKDITEKIETAISESSDYVATIQEKDLVVNDFDFVYHFIVEIKIDDEEPYTEKFTLYISEIY